MPRAEMREVWIASDGTEFETEAAAIQHEQRKELIMQLACSDICWRDGTDEEEVANWILKYYELIPKAK